MPGAWHRNTPRPDRSSWQWQQARQAALTRDGHRCRAIEHLPTAGAQHGTPGAAASHRCTARATEVDHIQPGDDHSLHNLLSLCSRHHRTKTQHEAAQARWKHRMQRTPEKHPGLLH